MADIAARVSRIIAGTGTKIRRLAELSKEAIKKGTDVVKFIRELISSLLALVKKDPKLLTKKFIDFFDKIFAAIKKELGLVDDIYAIRYIGRKLQPLVDETNALVKYGKHGKQTVQVVNNEVKRLISTLSKAKLQKHVMVSGMTYFKNGKISKSFVRHNFTNMDGIDEIGKLASNGKFLNSSGKITKYQKFLDDMHPTLRKRYDRHLDEIKKGLNANPSDIARAGEVASHGEIRALDDLLKEIDPYGKLGDDVFKDIVGYNRFLQQGANKIQPPCTHCHFLTTNVKFIGL